jgi:hypothetical protein
MMCFEKFYPFLPLHFGHKLRTKHTLRLNIIFVSKTRDMPYEEIYFQRLKEDNPEELEEL